mmetsp:Transcript_56041/g.133508  ORF Transcript_56041/g.133508 Transcript_56041/m.133508 type:complete len:260 (+) Transcript_56041:117-896(+)
MLSMQSTTIRSALLCVVLLSFSGCDAVGIRREEAKCLEEVVRGLDNLLGVCGAWEEVRTCGQSRSPQQACSKVKGPGGNLITQDIMEDVTLGVDTETHTASWHQAFRKCATEGEDCSSAAKLQAPVMQSVQIGLQKLLASSPCARTFGGMPRLSSAEFIKCSADAPGGLPPPSAGLRSVVQRAREVSPLSALGKFPLRGVVRWAEPHIQLPGESDVQETEDVAMTAETEDDGEVTSEDEHDGEAATEVTYDGEAVCDHC